VFDLNAANKEKFEVEKILINNLDDVSHRKKNELISMQKKDFHENEVLQYELI
jgi:hypothetical protein